MLNSTGCLACKGSYPSPRWIGRGDKLCMSFLIAVTTDEDPGAPHCNQNSELQHSTGCSSCSSSI